MRQEKICSTTAFDGGPEEQDHNSISMFCSRSLDPLFYTQQTSSLDHPSIRTPQLTEISSNKSPQHSLNNSGASFNTPKPILNTINQRTLLKMCYPTIQATLCSNKDCWTITKKVDGVLHCNSPPSDGKPCSNYKQNKLGNRLPTNGEVLCDGCSKGGKPNKSGARGLQGTQLAGPRK